MKYGKRIPLLLLAFTLSGSSLVMGQATKKLGEVTKRMESPQQKMDHADKIMREQDRTSSRRGVVDKRKNPKARPGVKRMVLPEKR